MILSLSFYVSSCKNDLNLEHAFFGSNLISQSLPISTQSSMPNLLSILKLIPFKMMSLTDAYIMMLAKPLELSLPPFSARPPLSDCHPLSLPSEPS